MHKPFIISSIFFVSLLAAQLPETAHASHKVYSPHVEKGELEFEIRGHSTRDADSEQDNRRKDIYEIGYGITEWWFSSVFLEYEKEHDLDYQHTATAWENIFQLTEAGKYWLDAGLYVEYETPEESGKADKLEIKLLLEKEIGRWVNTLNLIAEREVGSGAEDEVEFGYAWRGSYRMRRGFEPGFELYGGLGSDEDFGFQSGQTHLFGPVVSGTVKLGGDLKLGYEAGYLFGLNANSPSNTLKWVIELETGF